MRFNNIRQDIVLRLWELIDEGMTYREAESWLASEHRIYVSRSAIQRYDKDRTKYVYKKPGKKISDIKKADKSRVEEIVRKKKAADLEYHKKVRQEIREKINDAGRIKGSKLLDEDVFEAGKEDGDLREDQVAFKPNPGPQEEFLASSETDILFGGQAGGGKSVVLIIDPLRYAHRRKHRALILRRTLKELRQLIDLSRDFYPKAFPDAKYKEAEKVWVFPSGARIEFNYLEKEADVYQYQGQDFSWIGFDELTQLATEFPWNYLSSRLRTTDPEIVPCLRATANPGGVGNDWVRKRYISPALPNTAFVFERDRFGNAMTRKFIPSRLQDNPHLFNDGKYEAMLKSLPEVQRRQLLEGDWDVFEGAAFPEFNRELHVIQPFDIPRGWRRFRGIDYGYSAPSCCLWGAVNPEDGTLIIYRELYERGLTGEDLADRIVEIELEEMDPPMNGVVDGAVFNNTGYMNTIGSSLNKRGLKLKPANKDRKAGKVQIHERLAVREGERPRLQVFSTCSNLIREITTIPLKDKDPEDVDTTVDDHAYDALRYMCMSVPRATYRDMLYEYKRQQQYSGWQPADSAFGY